MGAKAAAENETFLIERYKYILDQKKQLNATSFKVVSIYQAGLALILGGCYKVVVAEQAGDIAEAAAAWFLSGLLLAFGILTSFSVMMICSGIAAWFAYRKDEASIELQMLGVSRPLPRLRDVFRWYETYILFAVILIAVVFGLYLHSVFPVLGI